MPVHICHVPSGKYLSVDSLDAGMRSPNLKSAVSQTGEPLDLTFYNAALVPGVDPSALEGAFGSASSLVFYVLPSEEVRGETLRDGVATIKVEHRPESGLVLHLAASGDPKPAMLLSAGMGRGGHLDVRDVGGQLGFATEDSGLDALKIMPLGEAEANKLTTTLAYIPLFKKYAYAYHVAACQKDGGGAQPPIPAHHLCEPLASLCLDILDELRKGDPPVRRGADKVADALELAAASSFEEVSKSYGGEPDGRMQRMACELKLLDAVFEFYEPLGW